MSPKYSAKVLSGVTKPKKAVMPLTENICVWAKLHFGMNCSAVGHDFNVNQPTIYIKYGVFKQKHTQSKVLYWLANKNGVNRSLQYPNTIFPLRAMVHVYVHFTEHNYGK